MSENWMYQRADTVQGPVTHDSLKQLAATGGLAPADLVWPEGSDPRFAIPAQSVVKFPARQKAIVPDDWQAQVAQALKTPPRAAGGTPDWLAEIRPEPPTQPPAPPPAPPQVRAVPPAPVAEPAPVARPAAPAPLGHPVTYPPGLVLGGATSRGRVRDRNEDRFQIQQWNWNDIYGTHQVGLLVVADGMGGYQAGDVASELTAQTIAKQLTQVVLDAMSGRPALDDAISSALDLALKEANRTVFQMAKSEASYADMGATVAAVVVWDGHAYYAHVGDCRVYLHRESHLKQLTEDHTLVARLVAQGQLTPAQAANHERRNEVTQAVGKRSQVTPSQGMAVLQRGDSLVVACDGLAAHVEDKALGEALNGPAVPPQHLANLLVNLADEGGGSDNCTVIVAQFA